MKNLLKNTAPLQDNELNCIKQEIKNKSIPIFSDGNRYISSKRLYFAYFETVPSMMRMQGVRPEKAIEWIENEFSDLISNKHYWGRSIHGPKQDSHIINTIYILKNEVILDLDNCGTVVILFHIRNESFAKTIEISLRKFQQRNKARNQFNLLIETMHGLELVPVKNKKPKFDLQRNYNDDLGVIHDSILKNLNSKGRSGLYLFHGIPGTGKSTYIRHLIHKMKKKVIFIPPRLVSNLDSPSMTGVLLENPNSVFIIEDAEELIKSRESGGSSNISILLNITDGMLGESLGIQVICTFNTQAKNIDEALLRKGRLNIMYQFNKLNRQKTLDLLNHLGHKDINIIQDEMTLADIYNIEQEEMKLFEKSTIGFLAN
jgi:hypothetical protein